MLLIALVLLNGRMLNAQSPHGATFAVDCAACHVPQAWNIMRDSLEFDHGGTALPLAGQHITVDCRSCHVSLDFDVKPPSDCVACHTDVHAMTVGNDCARCHTEQTWLVDDIPELHEQNGFPLLGAHLTASCVDCHISENTLAFQRIGNECINCHRDEYTATRQPDHVASGFSTDCDQCHDPTGNGWSTTFMEHDFFPLTQGHDIQDCARCHTSGTFAGLSPECVSCHLDDYNTTSDPNHSASGFSTDCASCHTTAPGWTPATFDHDDQFFPIYSGSHNGVWTACTDCHTNPNDFSVYTCITCHTEPETGNEHPGITGYTHESTACLMCHPTGEGDGAFDHSTTDFPLVGSHVGVNCVECHANGYAGTPTNCSACHMADYNSATNPNHNAANFPTDCAQCHNETAWEPSTFDHDNDYFPIYSGNHNGEWNACVDCHTNPNDYSVFTCIDCHEHDDQNEVNNDHNGVNNYSYNSNACYSCHPDGSN